MSPSLLVLQLLAAAPETMAIQEPASPPTWYGAETLIADGSATLLIAGATVAGNTIGHTIGSPAYRAQAIVTWLGIGVYVLGGPLIHFRHERGGEALRDLAIRVLVPIPFFIGGALIRTPEGGIDLIGHGLIGAMIGCIFISAVDAGMLAWAPAAPAHAEHPSFQLTPVVGASRGGAPFAGLGGRF